VISPDGGKEGFPVAAGGRGQVLLRSQDVQPLRRLALHAGVPGGRDVHQPGRRGADRPEVLPGCAYCVQACPYGCRYIHPTKQVADKCTLCYHRITKGLTTACCEACPTGARQLADLKNPNDPIHEF
jgi:tetrathionate reductase subunit B